MNDEGQVCAAPRTWLDRLQWRLNHHTWPYTSKVAGWVHNHTRQYLEPNHHNAYSRWERFMAGLAEGCWTHVCGHGPQYSFHIAMIYWRPRKVPADVQRDIK